MGIQTVKIPIGKDAYIKQGDTIPKITFTFNSGSGIDLTSPETEVKMQVISNRNNKFINVSNLSGGITIESALVFSIDEVSKDNNDFPIGTSKGDLEITMGGKRFTFFNVEYTVLLQYTKS